ncbi:hypothetical protein COOONC_24594 [Cooperia oncophora]
MFIGFDYSKIDQKSRMENHQEEKYKSTELAILLGMQYDDWSGLPIKSLLTSSALKRYEVRKSVVCI